jgi:Leucine-rich repeat (LRR) protein
MRLLINVAFTVFLISLKIRGEEVEEDYDATDGDALDVIPFTHFCNFDLPMFNHTVADDEEFCNCDVVPSPMIGRPSVKINCKLSDHVANLTNKVFQAQKLPVNTVSLTLSHQHFTEIPEFVGDQLKHLDMSNNFITIIKDLNFIHVTSLEHLDVSFNAISEIQSVAFSQLQHLCHLDLTSNRLVVLPANVFAPLILLETLKLTSNEGFGRITGRDAVNSSLTSLYLHLGVTRKLKNLEMERCNMTSINLRQGDGLKSVSLAFNEFKNFANIEFPDEIVTLDLSGNPVRHLTAKCLPHLPLLEELLLRDLPYLGKIDDYALYGLPKLRHLTLENSRNLSFFNGHSFGSNVVENEVDLELKVLNLRGCSFKTLNSSLETVFDRLEELHLDGNPFVCDCEIKWLKFLEIETNLMCEKPDVFNGKLLSEVPEKKMKCENKFLKKFINTMILLSLLIVCSLTIWFFLRRLNPSRRNKFQKVGPESPYQRVTIEPNRAEYSLY